MPRELRPGRTVVATLLGGIVGMGVGVAVGGAAIEPMMDVQELATLLPVLWSAIVGIVLGTGIALVVAFHDEPARARTVTAGTVLVVGFALFVGALTEVVDVMVLDPDLAAVEYRGCRDGHERARWAGPAARRASTLPWDLGVVG